MGAGGENPETQGSLGVRVGLSHVCVRGGGAGMVGWDSHSLGAGEDGCNLPEPAPKL